MLPGGGFTVPERPPKRIALDIEATKDKETHVNIMQAHTVESTTETVRSGFLGPKAPPVATLDSMAPEDGHHRDGWMFWRSCTYPD